MTQQGRPGVFIYPFWQRREFLAFVIPAVIIAIAGAVQDSFGADKVWLLVTILASSYILSRGLAKREPRDDSDDRPWTPGS
jgi:hypothetical protein